MPIQQIDFATPLQRFYALRKQGALEQEAAAERETTRTNAVVDRQRRIEAENRQRALQDKQNRLSKNAKIREFSLNLLKTNVDPNASDDVLMQQVPLITDAMANFVLSNFGEQDARDAAEITTKLFSNTEQLRMAARAARGEPMQGAQDMQAKETAVRSDIAGISAMERAREEPGIAARRTEKIDELYKTDPLAARQQALDLGMPKAEIDVRYPESKAARPGALPAGYRETETGLEFVPGGPADPEIIKKQAESRKIETSKISAETSYIPIGDGKYQYMSVDKAEGTTKPILRDGKPIILSEKEVLISEGKKAQSLINPYENKFMSKLGDSEGSRLTELKKTALDSRESLILINQARAQLDKGIYSGAGANIRKSFDKFLQEAGIYVGGRKAANTETYASMMGLQVGKIIKNFGSGTGLSDADREYAESIVGGRVTLTEDAIRQLLDINERLAKFNLQEYNDQAERAKRNIEEKDYLTPIEIPSEPIGSAKATPAGAAPPAAIEALRQNPGLKSQFLEKYGYLPEGF